MSTFGTFGEISADLETLFAKSPGSSQPDTMQRLGDANRTVSLRSTHPMWPMSFRSKNARSPKTWATAGDSGRAEAIVPSSYLPLTQRKLSWRKDCYAYVAAIDPAGENALGWAGDRYVR